MVERKKPRFRPHELALLHVLSHAGFEMSTAELAGETGMGWETAKHNLDDLYERGLITKRIVGNRTYWLFEG